MPTPTENSGGLPGSEQPAPMSLSYRLGRALFRFFFKFYFRWRIYSPENVPLNGPAILASNHDSFLDPPLVGSALPRAMNYLARESLFRFPVLGAILRSWNAVPVNRDRGAGGLKAILARLLAGGAVIVFPEGTRRTGEEMREPRTGIGLLVVKSEAPVIPVRVFGTFEAYPRSKLLPRPYPVAVKYGRPLWFRELREEAKNCSKERLKEIYHCVADTIMREIAALEPKL